MAMKKMALLLLCGYNSILCHVNCDAPVTPSRFFARNNIYGQTRHNSARIAYRQSAS